MKELPLSEKQQESVRQILIKEGFSDNQIDVMTEPYRRYFDDDAFEITTQTPLVTSFLEFYMQTESKPRSEVYRTIPEQIKKQVPLVKGLLKQSHVNLEQAYAIYLYSKQYYYYALQFKRSETEDKPTHTSLLEETFEKIKQDCKLYGIEFDEKKIKTALLYTAKIYMHKGYQKLDDYLENVGIPGALVDRFEKFLFQIYNYQEDRDLIKKIDRALEKPIQHNSILYRGVDEEFAFENYGEPRERFSLGERFEERGFLSTSLTYNASFAPHKDNVVLRLIVPTGTQGLNIVPFSDSRNECEVLLNSCDLYLVDKEQLRESQIIAEETGVPPKMSGLSPRKIVYTFLVLSKDRSCYKDLANEDENE